MNNTVELLEKAAELEKKAFTEYVTSFTGSGITKLVRSGLAFEKAASLIKEACEASPEVLGMKANIELFSKSAEYIRDLESKVGELEKEASEVSVPEKDTSPLSKLASIGFSEEEIAMMDTLPKNLITKVANLNAQPWEMGGGVGIPRERTDPLLEFILG